MQTSLLATALALLIERRLGYADWLSARIGHPVAWIGSLVSLLETLLNRENGSARRRRLLGVVMLTCVLIVTGVVAAGLMVLARTFPHGWILEALIATSLFCQKELGRRVEHVADELDVGLERGREAVRHLVGRDHRELDRDGVCKGAIESLAENGSDGVVAPAFWMIVGGLPGAALYKAINTCDSMVGYRTRRHAAFGWISAKLDDAANLVPSRLAALLFVLVAFGVDRARGARAWTVAWRDAPKHASPNAGWPEAAMAGALDTTLGGPRKYGGIASDLPRMGDGAEKLTTGVVRKALKLYRSMLNALIVLIVLIVVTLAVWSFI